MAPQENFYGEKPNNSPLSVTISPALGPYFKVKIRFIDGSTMAPPQVSKSKPDPWKTERSPLKDELGCTVEVEVPQDDPSAANVHRSSAKKCQYVQVEVKNIYRDACFIEEATRIPDYSQPEDTPDRSYYDPKVAKDCCLAPPDQHDYFEESGRRPRGRKAFAKDRVPQDALSYEAEFFRDIFSMSRSGACYDLKSLSPRDQIDILRKILTTPPSNGHHPALDIINFTYQDQWVPPPRDLNKPEEIADYTQRLQDALNSSSDLEEQRLTALLAVYSVSLFFNQTSLNSSPHPLNQSLVELYQASLKPGETHSAVFDTDLDGIYDSEDPDPLVAQGKANAPHHSLADQIAQQRVFLENYSIPEAAPDLVDLKSTSGLDTRLKKIPDIRFARLEDKLELQLCIDIQPQFIKDAHLVRRAEKDWAILKAKVEDRINAHLPHPLQVRIVEASYSKTPLFISENPSPPSTVFSEQDIQQHNDEKLLDYILNHFFSFGGRTLNEYPEDAPGEQAPAAMLYQPGRSLLTDPTPQSQENIKALIQEQILYAGTEILLKAMEEQLLSPKLGMENQRILIYRRADTDRLWNNIPTPTLSLGNYMSIAMGSNFFTKNFSGHSFTAARIHMPIELGTMLLLGPGSLQSPEKDLQGGFSVAYRGHPIQQGSAPKMLHGFKLSAVLNSPIISQKRALPFPTRLAFLLGPTWEYNPQSHQGQWGVEASLYGAISNLPLGVGLSAGLAGFSNPNALEGWFTVGLMAHLPGIYDRKNGWRVPFLQKKNP